LIEVKPSRNAAGGLEISISHGIILGDTIGKAQIRDSGCLEIYPAIVNKLDIGGGKGGLGGDIVHDMFVM
jgi:hypothetical protein